MNDYTLLPTIDHDTGDIRHKFNNSNPTETIKIKEEKGEYMFHILRSIENETSKKETNKVSTSKYRWYNAVPKILQEQFSKMVNIYYLIIAILQSIKEISYSGGVPVILLPLAIVTMINGLKDFFEDLKRKHSDDEENNRPTDVFDIKTNSFQKTKWQNVRLGDIVRIKNKESFPSDLILLKSSNANGICFIETKNIDGETNLKYRFAKKELSDLCNDENSLSKFDTKLIKANQPNDQIYQFDGKIYGSYNTQSKNAIYNSNYVQVNQDCLLLRGCNLEHTDYIIGIAVYLGHHTKSMMNSPIPRTKTSKVEDIMNYQIFLILILQVVLSVFAGFFNLLGYYYGFQNLVHYIYLANTSEQIRHFTFRMFLTRAGTWILIFTNFVPISLLVTMEMIKFVQGMFISWDIEMIDKKRGFNAKVQTSTLNEELGQVSYIFSDKTGTLTNNCMKFKKMLIGTEIYGQSKDAIQNKQEPGYYLQDKYGIITKTAFVDYNNKFSRQLKETNGKKNYEINHFMTCLSLCHSVVYDYNQWNTHKQLIYKGSSSDEIALLDFTRQFNYIFKEKTSNEVILEIQGETNIFEVISVLSYSSERRRMSIIVKSPDGKHYLYTKGDDSIIQSKLKKTQEVYNESVTQSISKSFAQEGLRTLAIAYKELNDEEIKMIKTKLVLADDRTLNYFYNDIENNLLFLGITAIEDELQEEVEKTLASFVLSGIKVWILTGDKRETAVAIGYSCGLLNKDQYIVNIAENGTLKEINSELLKAEEQSLNEKISMVISTKELNIIFNERKEVFLLFLSIAIKCHTVICSRITPKQKGELVQLIKTYLKGQGTTLAIGDGANDVTMLSTADIGIGINGVEGAEAARASDYSIPQFQHLKRLLFVHGRESYRKNTFVVCYNFYKNALFVMPQFWMGIISYFSGQVLFDRWIYQFFNTFYTCIPIIWYGIYDTEIYRKVLLRDSFYYKQGINSRLFHSGRFWKWVFFGCIQGLFVFIFSFYTFQVQGENGKMQDLWSIGTMAYSGIVLIANLKIIQYTTSHTFISILIVLASILCYYLSVYLMAKYCYFYIFNNWRMILFDLRFYYGTIGLLVLVFSVDIGVNRIIEYYSYLPSTKKEQLITSSIEMSSSDITREIPGERYDNKTN